MRVKVSSSFMVSKRPTAGRLPVRLIGLVLLSLGLLLPADLSAQGAAGEGDPDCIGECHFAFQDALENCFDANGLPAEDCLFGADEELIECLAECGEGPPPPPPNECFVSCDQSFELALRACEESGDEACFMQAELAQLQCLVTCEGAEVPEEEICRRECDIAHIGAMNDCVSEDGTVDQECVAAVNEELGFCYRDNCDIEIPDVPDPDPCDLACNETFEAALRACEESGDPGLCFGLADLEFVQCSTECHEDGVPGEERCFFSCEISLQRAQLECFGEDGEFDAECWQAAEETFGACLTDCGFEPPEPQPCDECQSVWAEAFEACEGDANVAGAGGIDVDGDGIIDGDCFLAANEAMNQCFRDCGVDVPDDPEIQCPTACEREYLGELGACQPVDENGDGIIDGGAAGDLDSECAQQAHRNYEACLGGCGIGVPPDAICLPGCESDLQGKLGECEDGECERDAFAEYEVCLADCGFDIPDLPEPNPCMADCDRLIDDERASCFQADGTLDEECARGLEELYSACIQDCGVVIPDLPDPGEGNECLSHCDNNYGEEFEACFNQETGEVDEACLAQVDSHYLACARECGIEIPENDGDVAGVPDDECSQNCTENLIEEFVACLDFETGAIDEECFAALSTNFETCFADCGAAGDERAIVANLRAGQGPSFLRGDANSDTKVDLSDAVWILAELFTGGPESTCRDAADANDDGQLNISDPVSVLNTLFLGTGPLPEPTDIPGRDPTVDALGCVST